VPILKLPPVRFEKINKRKFLIQEADSMEKQTLIERNHPLRELFRKALDFGLTHSPCETEGVAEYIEEQILCEFIHSENLYRIRDAAGDRLEDIAEMLAEGNVLLNAESFEREFQVHKHINVLLNAESFEREFQVHKHIGDYTLFMLSMFPAALASRKGKEFVLGQIVIPGASLSDHYILQGQRSYRIASEFRYRTLFQDLASNFELYKNVLELVRIYLDTARDVDFLRAKDIISGTA
jgi:hypothetical protein